MMIVTTMMMTRLQLHGDWRLCQSQLIDEKDLLRFSWPHSTPPRSSLGIKMWLLFSFEFMNLFRNFEIAIANVAYESSLVQCAVLKRLPPYTEVPITTSHSQPWFSFRMIRKAMMKMMIMIMKVILIMMTIIMMNMIILRSRGCDQGPGHLK